MPTSLCSTYPNRGNNAILILPSFYVSANVVGYPDHHDTPNDYSLQHKSSLNRITKIKYPYLIKIPMWILLYNNFFTGPLEYWLVRSAAQSLIRSYHPTRPSLKADNLVVD